MRAKGARTLALAPLVLAALSVGAADRSPADLGSGIDRVVDRPAFGSAFWGIEVRSLRTGRILYARNALKNLTPASTLKLVTTAAALDAFGPDARLSTIVETAGRLDGLGRVLGDVYLVGGGDTSLSGRFGDARVTAAFEALADQLLGAGVRRIEGRIVGHEGLFKGERRGTGWGWEGLVWWYGAEVSALSFNDNSADLRVAPGEQVGNPAVVDWNPVSSYYSVVSTATTSPAGAKSDLSLRREAGSSRIQLSGSVPLRGPPEDLHVALEDPARYAATVFSEVLASKGIFVAGPVATASEPLPAGLRVLATRESPAMAEILKAANKPSQNLHAEMLLRLLGARTKGEGSAEAGLEAVGDFLRRSGVSPESWALKDGSGLSAADLLTPHGLVGLLVAMDRHPHARPFRDSLPVAGVDGTLEGRMKGTPAEGRIVAKTGSIVGANALAGYATTRGGERLAFAVVVNHHTAPAREAIDAIDAICVLLVD